MENTNNANDIQTSIKWWEKKRLTYNVISLLGGILVHFLRNAVPNGIGNYNFTEDILFWLVICNLFYCGGWCLEILLNYYFKFRFFNNKFRLLLFVIGCLLSFFCMFIMVLSLP